jgi:hypothetical protein
MEKYSFMIRRGSRRKVKLAGIELGGFVAVRIEVGALKASRHL